MKKIKIVKKLFSAHAKIFLILKKITYKTHPKIRVIVETIKI
jgi:hypothetical protein